MTPNCHFALLSVSILLVARAAEDTFVRNQQALIDKRPEKSDKNLILRSESEKTQESPDFIPHEVDLGPFFAKLEKVTDVSFTFVLNFSNKEFPDIEFYEFIIVKLNKDVNDIPRLSRIDPRSWETFISYTEKHLPNQPYVAARYQATMVTEDFQFTAGDKRHIGGYYNGPLHPGSFYIMFLRGTKQIDGQTLHIASHYFTDPESPQFPLYFHTTAGSKNHLMKLGVGLGVGALLLTATVIGLATNVGIFGRAKRGLVKLVWRVLPRFAWKRRRKWYRYSKVGNRSEEESESDGTREKGERRKKKKRTVRGHNERIVHRQTEPVIYLQPSSAVKSASLNHAENHDLTQEVPTKDTPVSHTTLLMTNTTPVVPTLDVGKLDITPRVDLSALEVPPSPSSSDPDSLYNDTPVTPISNPGPHSPAIRAYAVPESPNTELRVDTPRIHADSDRKSRNINRAKEEIKRRMSVYRWLVRLKHEGQLPVDTDVKEVLEGRFSVPRHILDRYRGLLSKDTVKYFNLDQDA